VLNIGEQKEEEVLYGLAQLDLSEAKVLFGWARLELAEVKVPSS
jgi:hypothetical protein